MSFFTAVGASPDDGHDTDPDWKADPEPQRALFAQRGWVDLDTWPQDAQRQVEQQLEWQRQRQVQEMFRVSHQMAWLCVHYHKHPDLLTREDRDEHKIFAVAHRGRGYTGYEGQGIHELMLAQVIMAQVSHFPSLN